MKIKANAKINLSLCVKGKRPDGYHFIDTVMHSVSLFDELEIRKSDSIMVWCDRYDIPMEDNLAYKAAKLFFEEYGISGGAHITIKKNIPVSAGLGGGSADAAAVLLGLNALYSSKISNKDLEKTALKLGADVPFFIDGGCKRAEGIGEIFTAVEPLKNGYILLAKAEQKASTAEMYRIVDSKEPISGDTAAVVKAVKENDLKSLSYRLFNSFTAVWEDSFVKKALSNQSPLAVSLSGSGPTCFGLFDDFKKAEKAKIELAQSGIDCWLVKPSECAIIFE